MLMLTGRSGAATRGSNHHDLTAADLAGFTPLARNGRRRAHDLPAGFVTRNPRIGMTWAGYQRCEATYNGRPVPLSGSQADLLLILMLRRGQLVQWPDLIFFLWGGQDDGGPLDPHTGTAVRLHGLRQRLPGIAITTATSLGLRLERPGVAEQRPDA